MRVRPLFIAILFLCSAACSAGRPAPPTPTATPSSGTVQSAGVPVSGATVTLYRAGSTGDGRGAVALGHTQTAADGTFTIANIPATTSGVLYYVATGGSAGKGTNAAISLATVTVPGSPSAHVEIDELSTIAFAYALAQFSDASGTQIGATASNKTGLRNAAALEASKIVDPASGAPTSFWPTTCTTQATDNCEGLETLNSLASALAACNQSTGSLSSACAALRHATGVTPNATGLAAAHALVMYPARDVSAIYALARANSAYKPTLPVTPPAWVLALKFVGNGHEFDGPGNVAFDAAGNIWITNNYVYNSNHLVPTCGGEELIELTALGDDAAGAPFTGGGISGAGWGIAFDARNRLWVGDFGFKGAGCTSPPPANAVSLFTDSGVALSPAAGYTNGSLSGVQGVALDFNGNIWMANNGNNSITVYRDADPNKEQNFTYPLMVKPFGLEVDKGNRIWISNTLSHTLTVLQQDGTQAAFSPVDLGSGTRPLGLAIDQEGNAWVPESGANALAVIGPTGKAWSHSPVSGGGVATPWGIGIDGNGNAWVANFTGTDPRVSEICGVRGNCPRGISPGQPITPATGYASSLLQRLTGVAIDPSGNVWAVNNWLPRPLPTNPGGDGMVLFVGLAAPVKAPQLGPPASP